MGYLYEKTLQALGGSKLEGAQGLDYGNWTPNGVRSVLIAQNAIVVEYHPPYNKGKLAVTQLKMGDVMGDIGLGTRMKDPLRALELKQFNTLEEIIIDARLGIDPQRYMSKVDGNDRLRQVSVVNWSAEMTNAYVARLPQLRASNASATAVNGLKLPVVAAIQGPGVSDWPKMFYLNPRVYKSDLRGGALDRYFRQVASEHGVMLDDDKVTGEAVSELNPLEVANIKAHRQNVAADMRNYERLEYLLKQIKLLSASKSLSQGVDKESVTDLHKRLVDVAKRTGGDVPGLQYYLTSYAEQDGVPEGLIKAYKNLGYLGEDKKSRAEIKEANGYFNFDEGVMKAIRQVYKSRMKRRLYVPDADRFTPSLTSLGLFIDLITGKPFDYVKYSYDLEIMAESGEAEVIEDVINVVETAKKDTDRSTATRELAKSIDSNINDGFETNASFLVLVRKGAVDAGRSAYSSVSGIAWDAINNGYEPAKNLVVAGTKIFLSKKTPWGALLAPLVDSVISAASPAIVEALNGMFDALDQAVEGERRGDEEEVDEQLATALDGLFETEILWDAGALLMDDFLSTVVSFSTLKKRQITRLARSKSGVKGLKAYIKSRESQFGGSAKAEKVLSMFDRWGYTSLVEGAGVSVDLAKNPLLAPRAFYEKVFKQFNSLGKMAENRDRKQREGLDTWDQLCELDSMCRDVIGVPSRQYPGYTPRSQADVGRSATIGERLQGKSSSDVGF